MQPHTALNPTGNSMAQLTLKKKTISVFTLVMINIIAIDSLRNLPINATYGWALPFYYLLCCLFFLIPCALITAELATHYPMTGGAYVWVRQAFGERLGFVAIWLQWIYNVFWYPTILAFVAANLAYLVDPALIQNKTYMVSMIIVLFFFATVVNGFGMQTSGWVSIVSALLGTVFPMLTIVIMAGVWLASNTHLAFFHASALLPHSGGFKNMAFLVTVFFSVFGLEMSATHAASVKHPERDYPKALLYSSIFIVVSLILSTLAIAVVVPADALSLIAGLNQAFALFLRQYHLENFLPLLILAIVLGSFGSIAAWVIGPTKGLMVAAKDGSLPRWLCYTTRKNSPLAVLGLQALLVMCLCSLFVFIPAFNTSYWILTDLTAQLALVFYLFFFVAAWRLHDITPPKAGAFRLKTWVLRTCVVFGTVSCLFALGMGFVPPSNLTIHSLARYETLLVGGLLVFSILPLIIFNQSKKKSTR